MEIEMPRMDGLTALREIMLRYPLPVMMISSLTTDGAAATLDALEMGAVDFIPKQLSYVSLDIVKIKDDLLAKIKDIARRKNTIMTRLRLTSVTMRHNAGAAQPAATAVKGAVAQSSPGVKKRHVPIHLVAIGSSTGGPPALQAIIPQLPRNFPVGVLVVQHMPPMFTKSLADRLNGMSQVTVKEAADGDLIEPATVYIAPGGMQMTVRRGGNRGYITVSAGPPEVLYHPCVDITMNSVAKYYPPNVLAIILTGMGSNGVLGIRSIKTRGGAVIAQDEASCVVYGMPKAVVDAELADAVMAPEAIAAEIATYF
jgi:two-component system chemotaxis response regulator CheB